MANPSDKIFRDVLGPNLQTASMRALLLLAGLSVVGGLLAWIIR